MPSVQASDGNTAAGLDDTRQNFHRLFGWAQNADLDAVRLATTALARHGASTLGKIAPHDRPAMLETYRRLIIAALELSKTADEREKLGPIPTDWSAWDVQIAEWAAGAEARRAEQEAAALAVKLAGVDEQTRGIATAIADVLEEQCGSNASRDDAVTVTDRDSNTSYDCVELARAAIKAFC